MAGVLIVTGASRGIGAATARLAGERGYHVAVNYNASPERAAEVRYLQFEAAIAQMHSGRGFLKFRPLRESFKEDFDALKTRYVAEHPDTPVPE